MKISNIQDIFWRRVLLFVVYPFYYLWSIITFDTYKWIMFKAYLQKTWHMTSAEYEAWEHKWTARRLQARTASDFAQVIRDRNKDTPWRKNNGRNQTSYRS